MIQTQPVHKQMHGIASDGKHRAFYFRQNKVTCLKEPTKLPQKSNTVNANVLLSFEKMLEQITITSSGNGQCGGQHLECHTLSHRERKTPLSPLWI